MGDIDDVDMKKIKAWEDVLASAEMKKAFTGSDAVKALVKDFQLIIEQINRTLLFQESMTEEVRQRLLDKRDWFYSLLAILVPYEDIDEALNKSIEKEVAFVKTQV